MVAMAGDTEVGDTEEGDTEEGASILMQLSELDRMTWLLSDYLDIQSRRAEVVAGNLANADTPGYKAKELAFKDYLRTAAEYSVAPGQTAAAMAEVSGSVGIVEQTGNTPGIDGNTVDTGREMATLADAGMQFLAGSEMLQSHFRMIRAAIREGR
jgi:flagellar basal-body rod protein FlgB